MKHEIGKPVSISDETFFLIMYRLFVNVNQTDNMEGLLKKYQRAKKRWHIMFHKFQESEQERAHFFEKYITTKEQLKDANERIAELEQKLQQKKNVIKRRNALIIEQYNIIEKKQAQLVELLGPEKDFKLLRIYPNQRN